MRHIFREPRLIQSLIIPKQPAWRGSLRVCTEESDKKQRSEIHGLASSKSGLGSSTGNLVKLGSAVVSPSVVHPVSKQFKFCWIHLRLLVEKLTERLY